MAHFLKVLGSFIGNRSTPPESPPPIVPVVPDSPPSRLPRISRSSLGPDHGLAAFVDVETTGLDTAHDEVIELAITLFCYDKTSKNIVGVIDDYVGLREPGCWISVDAILVHGIGYKKVEGKCLDEPRIVSMLEAADFVVAHNANFDRRFVERLFEVAKTKRWLCSMSGINWYGYGFNSRGLGALLKEHQIESTTAHRADSDVEAALLLLSKTKPDGESYFSELVSEPAPRPRERMETSRSTSSSSGESYSSSPAWLGNISLDELDKMKLGISDRWAALHAIMDYSYGNRDTDPNALATTITACERLIELAPRRMKYLKRYKGSLLEYEPFRRLAIIREKQGDYGEAIRLSTLAMEQGWEGDWEKRIARCEKRLNKNGKK